MIDAGYFLEKAEQCFRICKTGGLDEKAAAELKELGHDLMAKAVYLDTLNKRGIEPCPNEPPKFP